MATVEAQLLSLADPALDVGLGGGIKGDSASSFAFAVPDPDRAGVATMLKEVDLRDAAAEISADQVSTAIVQIREAAGQMATEQELRLATAESVDDLVRKVEDALTEDAQTNNA